ncbi:MAG: hypothetical protein K8V75_06915 [Methanobrevibacter woesei]|nr:hypothetical protein [Methanobrevibacter woesei]
MKYVTNAFSLQMLREPDCLVNITEIDYDAFKALSYDAYSVIGHHDIAGVLGLEYNRESIKINEDDVVLVAQLFGGRLPENCTELPEDVELRFFCIRLMKK